MKKKLMIVLLVLIVILSLTYVFYNIYKLNHKNNNETENIYRDDYVEKFAKQGKIEKFKGSGDESGYNGVIILNKDKLIKIISLDEFTGMTSRLNSSINNINLIANDEEILTTEYFKENKTFVNENFGIKSQSEFKKFMKYLGYSSNNKLNIKKCSIENAVKKENNIYIDLLINNKKLKVKIDIKNDEANNVKYDIYYIIP